MYILQRLLEKLVSMTQNKWRLSRKEAKKQKIRERGVDLDKWIANEKSPKPISKPNGKWMGIAAGCLAVIGLVVWLVSHNSTDIPINPKIILNDTTVVEKDTLSVSIEEAKKLLMDKAQAKDGFAMLQKLVDAENYEAVFLMSRCEAVKIHNEALAVNNSTSAVVFFL